MWINDDLYTHWELGGSLEFYTFSYFHVINIRQFTFPLGL